MKKHCTTLAAALATSFIAFAAVPLEWKTTPRNPAPAAFDRHHGETLERRCRFEGFGELPFADAADVRLWYQTNCMGAAWWSLPATVSSNVLSATFPPQADPGADRLALFFGAPSNAYASAVLRLRSSPGFTPNVLPPPDTESFEETDPVFSAWLADGYAIVSNAAMTAVRPEHFVPMVNAWASDANSIIYRANIAARSEAARALATEGDGETRSANTIFAQIDAATTTDEVYSIVTNQVTEYSDWVLGPNWSGAGINPHIASNRYVRAARYWQLFMRYYDPDAEQYFDLDGYVAYGTEDATRLDVTPIGDTFPVGYISRQAITRNALGVAMLDDLPPLTNGLPAMAAAAVCDVHDLRWDEEEQILYWCKFVGGHDLCIAVTNINLTHPTNAVLLKAWREANR